METRIVANEILGKKRKSNEISLFIIDLDLGYAKRLADSLRSKFNLGADVKTFKNGEAALSEINYSKKKPAVVVLDYLSNKPTGFKSEKHQVDNIIEICPKTGIIMLSEKQYENSAMKALAYGAHDLVIKDKFTSAHILNSIKKILNPPKL